MIPNGRACVPATSPIASDDRARGARSTLVGVEFNDVIKRRRMIDADAFCDDQAHSAVHTAQVVIGNFLGWDSAGREPPRHR